MSTAAPCVDSIANPCAAPPHPNSQRLRAWPLIAVAMGFIMAMLDVTVVNVALTDMRASLHIDLSALVWIVDGYTLTFASLLLIGGALANRYGARAVYIAGLVLFILASILCGAAPNGSALIAARLVQGIGAALFMPASLSLMTQSYPDDAVRTKVLAIWSAVISISGVMGPIVGGMIISALGWRGIFWLNVPIGIAGVLLTLRHIATSPRRQQALNATGHLSAVVGMAALAFVMIENSSYGWISAPILGAGALSVAALAAFVLRERHIPCPIIPRSLFKDVGFAASNGVGFCINLAVYGQLFLISLYLQQVRGADAWHTGLNLLPLLLMFTIGNLLSGRISANWGTRLPMQAGLVSSAILSGVLTAWGPSLPYAAFASLIALANLGVGIAVPAMTITLMRVAGQDHANIAAASLNANRQVGALIGVAAIGGILHALPDWQQALPFAFGLTSLGYLAGAILVWRYIQNPQACAPDAGPVSSKAASHLNKAQARI